MLFTAKWKCIYIILMVVLFVMTGIVFAQPQGQPQSPLSASDIVAKMKQELNLSDEQVSQITLIIQEEINQMQEFMEQARSQGAGPDAVRNQMDALRKNTESKFSQYLTQEQLTQWKNMQQHLQQKSGRMGPPAGEESFGDSR